MISAVLLDFGGVVANIRMKLVGEDGDGNYAADIGPGVIQAISELRKAGFKVALVSNNDRESFARHFPHLPLDQWFDAVVFSSDVGADKPQLPIYREALRLVHAEPEQAIFLDDLSRNVDAAVSLGMQGIVISSIEQTAPTLHQVLSQE